MKGADMNDDEAMALGLRVTAWMLAREIAPRWPGGVLYRDTYRQALRDGDGVMEGDWPDLRDPATFGVIVGVLEEALGFPVWFVHDERFGRFGWSCENEQWEASATRQPTRPHALVSSLEAVP